MRQITAIAVMFLFVLASAPSPARAQGSPHFIKGPTATIDTTTGDYTVSFKEAGLGSFASVTYSLSVDVPNDKNPNPVTSFTFQCYTTNNAGKPKNPVGGQPKAGASNTTVSLTLTPRNGQVTGSITMSPAEAVLSAPGCSGGQVLVLTAVDYQGVSFTDGVGNTFALPDLNVSGLLIVF